MPRRRVPLACGTLSLCRSGAEPAAVPVAGLKFLAVHHSTKFLLGQLPQSFRAPWWNLLLAFSLRPRHGLRGGLCVFWEPLHACAERITRKTREGGWIFWIVSVCPFYFESGRVLHHHAGGTRPLPLRHRRLGDRGAIGVFAGDGWDFVSLSSATDGSDHGTWLFWVKKSPPP
jgi:hypothetical protein